MRRRFWHYAGVVAAIAVFAAAVWALTWQLRDLRWDDLLRQLEAIPLHRVLAAVAATFAAYLVLAVYDHTAFRYIGRRMGFGRVAFVSSISYAFSHNLGFGALTGGAVRFRFYTDWGVSAGDIARVVLYAGIVYYLCALSVGGLLTLPNAAALAYALELEPGLVRTVAGVWVLSGALYVLWCLCGKPVVRLGEREVTPPKLRHGLMQFGVGILEWAFTSAVLYLVLPPDFGMPYWHFVAVYVLAYMAGYISHVPGGLGVFETVLFVLMPETVPTHVVAAGIITYRAIYFLLPLTLALTLFGAYEAARGRFSRGR
ncbi:MAG: lysylphosphatidylglycerol synthase domain-containing protein [Alphaproteobacteria bacterium]|nr:lysylphosphatidylglycerol synthase domain-containing protein [Alphaproteobacteria bacterium]MCY4318724.1 lysylphosphatidylglycerol synthase domain-containing protein [Alphaproteobacteria bacterium]